MRQTHHWAALVFVAAIGLHLLRIFFTGAFRRPRELNWVIGLTLFVLSLAEGFAGYSLPDDLLSGTGLRIAQGIMMSIPVVGTYVAFFAFGGEFPGEDIITRLYPLHVLLLPGALIALVTVHLVLVFHLKHTQWRGPGRSNRNVRGKPLIPQLTATSTGLSLAVFGVLVLLSGVAQVNPVWMYGPYRADLVSTGSPARLVRRIPGGRATARTALGDEHRRAHRHVERLLPAVVLPGLLFAVLYAYPFVEQRLTGERLREQHLCDRPRERPVRTGLGVAGTVFYGVLLVAGGNDIIAYAFRISVDALTWVLRIARGGARPGVPGHPVGVPRPDGGRAGAPRRGRAHRGHPADRHRGLRERHRARGDVPDRRSPQAALTGARTGTPIRTRRAPERRDR